MQRSLPHYKKMQVVERKIMHITISPIGTIYSAFNDTEDMARQANIDGKEGMIEVYEEYAAGLEGLHGFSHIIALYHFHKQTEVRLKAKPCFDKNRAHGIFASRYPARPNHMGISVLSLDRIEGNTLHCSNIDVLNGTPLLDIKPYVKHFDLLEDVRSGWYDDIDWDAIKREKRM